MAATRGAMHLGPGHVWTLLALGMAEFRSGHFPEADAALSGVVARIPIPVRLTVDLPRRPSPVIEAVAYFVVSEALANIAKHAQASQAEVFIQRASDRLHLSISDDGVGGADPSRGTGLTGLARRASSVDGTFEITSPPGGPTLLTVDLPCAR